MAFFQGGGKSVSNTIDAALMDDQIAALRHEIRENRIQFWLCAFGIPAVLGLEALFIFLAFAVYGSRSGWTPIAVLGFFAAAAVTIGLLGTAIKKRDALLAGRNDLRRAEEVRKNVAAGKGSTRLVVLNRYKNDLPGTVERFRLVAKRYRRAHNVIQFLTVVGSAAASVTIAVFGADQLARNVAIVATASVAVVAAYSGYFRYKEKSLSLQATADGIEQEHRAVQLGIGDYEKLNATDALSLFAVKVESLRTNQQRQAIELDQAVQVEYQAAPTYDLQ